MIDGNVRMLAAATVLFGGVKSASAQAAPLSQAELEQKVKEEGSVRSAPGTKRTLPS